MLPGWQSGRGTGRDSGSGTLQPEGHQFHCDVPEENAKGKSDGDALGHEFGDAVVCHGVTSLASSLILHILVCRVKGKSPVRVEKIPIKVAYLSISCAYCPIND